MHLQVYDFDGTISLPASERPFSVESAEHSFRVMSPDSVAGDRPYFRIIGIAQSTRLHQPNTKIVVLTGRPESSRQLSEAQLTVWGMPYDCMIMVGERNAIPTPEKKFWVLVDLILIHPWESITLIDDDDDMGLVVEALRDSFDMDISFIDAKKVLL